MVIFGDLGLPIRNPPLRGPIVDLIAKVRDGTVTEDEVAALRADTDHTLSLLSESIRRMLNEIPPDHP